MSDIKIENKKEQPRESIHEKPGILDKYVADHFPPNIEISKQHGLAKRVAKPVLPEKESQPIELCDCCGLPINNELLPLCISRSELAFLGPGFPLYFEFVVFCAVILGIMISVEGIYNIISNYAQGDSCQNTDSTCSISNINLISLSNKYTDHDLYITQSWVNFGCALVIMIAMHIFRRIQRLTTRECDRGLLSPSDYSLMISHLPLNEDYSEEDIKLILQDFWNKIPKSQEEEKKGFPFKKIVLSYNIGEYVELIRKKNVLLLKKRKAIAYEKKNNCYPPNFDPTANEEELQKTTNVIDELEKSGNEGIYKKKCGVAFISFNSELEKNIFFEKCSLTPFQKIILKIKMVLCFKSKPENLLYFRDRALIVEKAPEPNDVLWENLHYSTKYKIKIRFWIYLVTFILLIICFLIILGISFGQTKVALDAKRDSPDGNLSDSLQVGVSVLGVVASFSIVFINTALTLVLKKFGNTEKHSTLTHLGISNAIKLSCAQFFNTAIIILVVKLLALLEEENNIFSPGLNISSDLVSIFCTNAIFVPLINFFNPWYFIRLSKRRKIKNEGVDSLFTQAEANSAFEGGDIDLSVKYASLIKTVWLSGFYLTVTPIGCFISFFGIVVFYFVEKYLLLRRLSRPPLFSDDLNAEMVEMLEYVPLSMGLGSLIFHYILFDPSNNEIIADLLTICLSAINFIIPSVKINECLFKFDEEVIEETKYDDARITFPTDYDRANPVTQEAAINEWVELIEKKKGIQLKMEGMPNPLVDNKNINNEIEEGKNPPQIPNLKINKCLANYANANLAKLNNMIAQAPQNQNVSNADSLLPFFHLAQQQHNVFVDSNPNPYAPSFFAPIHQSNNPNLNHFSSPEKNPLIDQNPNQFPIVNNSIPNPINLGNPNFGAPPVPNNTYPYNNYPNMFPPPLIHQVPLGYNEQDRGNVYNPEQYNSYDVQESNYLTNPNHSGHQIPPQINPQPQFFPAHQNYNNYGNYGGGY